MSNINSFITACYKMEGYLPRLSIIIVSYNTKNVTDQCLKSIYQSTWRDKFEIIVVDNNSSDGSVDMIRRKYPEVKIIENKDNKLFAKANNQGAKIARGEYLLLLNSDTIVYDDNLQKMIDYFDTLPDDVICIGPTVLNLDKTVQGRTGTLPSVSERFICCFKLYKIFPWLDKVWHGLNINSDRPRLCGWVPGCSMMVRSNKFNEVGGLNEKLIFYGEEPEFGFRTWHKYRYKTIYFPGAEIIHLGGKSTKQVHNKAELEKKHLRYIALQEQTVGFSRAIKMSYVVLIAAYIKRLFHSDKEYFDNAIAYEKSVIEAMKAYKKSYAG